MNCIKTRQPLRNFFTLIILLVTFAFCFVARAADPAVNLSPATWVVIGEEKRPEKHIEADPLRIRLTMLGSNTITAKEPFFARLEFTNPGGKNISIVDGGCRGSTLYFAVKSAAGTTLFETPRPQYGESFSHTWQIQAGETFSRVLSLSGLYDFAKPGDYIIVVRRYQDSLEDVVLNEASVKLKVLPYNEAELKRRCDGLAAAMQASDGLVQEPLNLGLITKALYSVHDNVVLPHLEWMANAWSGAQADVIRSARRIGTAEANALVAKFAHLEGPVGKLAREGAPESGSGDWAWYIDLGPLHKDPVRRNPDPRGVR